MFGDGPLSAHVDATYNSGDLRQLTGANEHGYHVVGIAASSYLDERHRRRERHRRVPGHHAAARHRGDRREHADDGRADRPGRPRRGPGTWWSTRASAGTSPRPDAEAQQGGSDWAQLVRGTAGLEDRLLHATSAGNDAGPSSRNSRWSASLRADLTDAAGQPMGALRNTLAVENLVETPAPDFEPGCLGVTSNRGGTIAAVGTDVHSHLFGSAAGDKTGTSMASPQVAGLAMYLWSIAPDLTAPQVRGAMVATARPALPNDAGGCGTDVPSAPRLDAYAAVLSLDRPVALTPATAPVRDRDPRPRRRRGLRRATTSSCSRPPAAPTPATATTRAQTSTATASPAAPRPRRSISSSSAPRAAARRGSRRCARGSRASRSSSTRPR